MSVVLQICRDWGPVAIIIIDILTWTVSVYLAITDVTHHDAVSFPQFELCPAMSMARACPERATRTQHFGSSHSDQHKLGNHSSLWPYLRAR